MKLWKRVYVITLVIVTISVNVGFLGIIYFTYNKMLGAEKDRWQAEFVMMMESLSREVEKMEEVNSISLRQYDEYYNSDYFDEETLCYNLY